MLDESEKKTSRKKTWKTKIKLQMDNNYCNLKEWDMKKDLLERKEIKKSMVSVETQPLTAKCVWNE